MSWNGCGVLLCTVHTPVLPFRLSIQPGQPIYEQIVHAVKRAVASGRLQAGDRFPAVRTISQELGINPNTVQKAVSELASQRILEVHPGHGCFVARKSASRKDVQREALQPLIENLLIEAAHHGVSEEELLKLMNHEKRKLDEQRH